MIGPLGLPELIIIAFLVLLLFGGKKLPELFRSMGQAVREFKEASDGKNENKAKAKKEIEVIL